MRAFLIILVVASAALTSCGGDDDTASKPAETTARDTGTTTTDRPPETRAERPPNSGDEKDGDSSRSGASEPETTSTAPREYDPLEGSERNQAEAAVRGFFAALADRDGDRICAQLAEGTRKQFVRALTQSPQLKGKDCGALLELTTRNQPEQLRRNLKQVRVTEVFFKDDIALARYKIPSEALSVMPMVKNDGQWRVSALAGAPADRVPIP